MSELVLSFLITFSNTLGQERVRYYWDYFLQTQR